MSRAFLSKLGWILGSVLSLPACSSGDDDDSDSAGSTGTVRAPWTDFCTGTFTQNTPVTDAFDDPLFTARAGEEYLLAEYDDVFEPHAEFVYLTDAGPDTFEVSQVAGSFPFTSNCAIGTGVPYYAAFTDVSVYAEVELTTKICDIAAGTALPSSGSQGYFLAGDISFSGPAIYEVFLDAFGAQCGGNASGFVSVPQTRSFGVTTWLVPITGIIGPN